VILCEPLCRFNESFSVAALAVLRELKDPKSRFLPYIKVGGGGRGVGPLRPGLSGLAHRGLLQACKQKGQSMRHCTLL
jgi:hypothetical protein